MGSFIVKRLLRRPWLSLLSLVVSVLLCVMMCYLAGYLRSEEKRMEEIRNTYDVPIVVSDVKGTKTDKLKLTTFYTNLLRDETNGLGSFIRELRLVKQYTFQGDFGSGRLYGVSAPACHEDLDTAYGGSYEAAMEDFFAREEPVCLVSRALYDDYAGKQITLSIADPYGAPPDHEDKPGSGNFTVTVAGWHGGTDGDIFIPFPFARKLSLRISGIESADSAAFLLKDNTQINEMLDAASIWFCRVSPGAIAPQGLYGLIVQDEQYKATMTAMEQNIRRLRSLLPLITLLSLGAGFLVGFLSTRGEERTYALLRTVGLTRGRLFVWVLLEQLILPILAAAAVGVISGKPTAALVFLLCHTVGCSLATLRSVRIPPTRLLRAQE